MEHAHPAALWLMVASAVAAAVCCLAAGRAVPWQGKASALAMSIGMLVLVPLGDDPRVPLVVGGAWVAAAMIGTAGLRGHPSVGACCHRALGCIVMAACVLPSSLAGSADGSGAIVGHAGHGGSVPLAALTGLGVAAVLIWQIVDHRRRTTARMTSGSRRGVSLLLDLEGAAMAVGIVVMWLMHL